MDNSELVAELRKNQDSMMTEELLSLAKSRMTGYVLVGLCAEKPTRMTMHVHAGGDAWAINVCMGTVQEMMEADGVLDDGPDEQAEAE